ncbi:uncharacterized protein DUF4178 [Novosphingobium sp. PhB165]|uniref:DUF4178 domain-containing protein n=1 Tax=Novosphingobium sp. PhB165 TaxID=2485105 RepID=UPI00104BA602|nr:DUF4178 domain-containing protein [Novosphingobium sp. PhB165]TCM14220.1 uncharacterized protein DUF4178 [Novosphingobium sp. PhB165]
MNPPKSAVRAVSCPNCGGTLEVRAAGWSINLACQYCGSILDVSRPEVQIIERHNRAAAGFTLQLGSRGQLFDTEWEVIGSMERSDAWSNWREYLLLNPYVGYRWLVEYDGDWQFGTMLLDRPQESEGSVQWRGQRFRQEDEASDASIDTVIGEFYWRIASGDRALCASFTCRDFTLSREEADGEINWTQLVALSGGHMESAFGLSMPEPAPQTKRGNSSGRGYALFQAERRSDASDIPAMLGASMLTILAAALLMWVFAGRSAAGTSDIEAPFGRTAEGIRVGRITVSRPWQFVSIRARASTIENEWVDLDYSLVDRATGQSIDAYGLVEHYTGSDSDGPWSEGSTRTTTQFGHIPRGSYDVFVDAGAHRWPTDVPSDRTPSPWASTSASDSSTNSSAGSYDGWGADKPNPVPVEIVVQTNTMPQGNFWTLCILVMVMPAFAIYRGWKNR